jgi:hypothetical protein
MRFHYALVLPGEPLALTFFSGSSLLGFLYESLALCLLSRGSLLRGLGVRGWLTPCDCTIYFLAPLRLWLHHCHRDNPFFTPSYMGGHPPTPIR